MFGGGGESGEYHHYGLSLKILIMHYFTGLSLNSSCSSNHEMLNSVNLSHNEISKFKMLNCFKQTTKI